MNESECSHPSFQFVEMEKIVFQETVRTMNDSARLEFDIKAKARCLNCGHIAYSTFTRTIDVQFNLVIKNMEDEDPGEWEAGVL